MKIKILCLIIFVVSSLQSQGVHAGILLPLVKKETLHSVDDLLSITLKNLDQSKLGRNTPIILRQELGDFLASISKSATWGERVDVSDFMKAILEKGKCGANVSCQIAFNLTPNQIDGYLDTIKRDLLTAKVGDKAPNGEVLTETDIEDRILAARKLNKEPANFQTPDKLIPLKCNG